MILITRPKKEAEEFAEILEERGFECFIEPMSTIVAKKPELEKHFNKSIQAFLTTSKNAAKFAPVGYKKISIPNQGRTARELCDWVIKNLKPKDGGLIYLRGDVISLDIAKELKSHGFGITEIIVYNAIPSEKLSKELLNNITDIRLVTFFSAQGLKIFIRLLKKAKLAKALKNMDALCMSNEISKIAKVVGWRNIYTANEPSLYSMLEKVDEIFQ